jgi:hypothetical protein
MFNFYLSNIYKFEEVGTYTITANRLVDLPGEKQAQFSVGSNPLTIDIVPDK